MSENPEIRHFLRQLLNSEIGEIWDIMTLEERRKVVEHFAVHDFPSNTLIYNVADPPANLWVLFKGGVKKFRDGVGGRSQIIRMIRPVQHFGYRAYFAREPYGSSAMTIEDSIIGTVPLDLVSELIGSNPEFARFFIHQLARDLGQSDGKIVNLTQKHMRGRLAEAISALIDTYGYEPDGYTISMYLSREDLANLSNMTTGNAIRTLSEFAQDKLVVVDGRKIGVIDEKAIRKIARMG